MWKKMVESHADGVKSDGPEGRICCWKESVGTLLKKEEVDSAEGEIDTTEPRGCRLRRVSR